MSRKLLIVLLVGALPATVLAGGDWMGFTDEWSDTSNWSKPGEFGLDYVQYSVDPGDVAWYGGTNMPVISDGDNTILGFARIRNGSVVTQTGGYNRWNNGSSNYYAMNIFSGATLDMTGGLHESRGPVGLGWRQGPPPSTADGIGTINIWGDGVFAILPNNYSGSFGLDIRDGGSLIDIRDNGQLRVPLDLWGDLEDYEDAGKLVAGAPDFWLDYAVDGEQVVVTAVPEPAALLLLGLGGLMFVRRRRA